MFIWDFGLPGSFSGIFKPSASSRPGALALHCDICILDKITLEYGACAILAGMASIYTGFLILVTVTIINLECCQSIVVKYQSAPESLLEG